MSEYIVDVTGMESGDYAIAREEIVRCRDCKYHEPMVVSYLDKPLSVCISEQWIGAERDNPLVKPDGFCAWGEKASNFTTCKCGEDVETNGRESVTCPSCGRVVTE